MTSGVSWITGTIQLIGFDPMNRSLWCIARPAAATSALVADPGELDDLTLDRPA
jgi:hypothetical protein